MKGKTMKGSPMFVTNETVLAPFRTVVYEAIDMPTKFGPEKYALATVLPRHYGKAGEGPRDWAEPLDRKSARDDYGNYLCCAVDGGQVVLAHESELEKVESESLAS